jgi:hypothetical protein
MRLWWTALLVLIALGGAGLAVAADRPQSPLQRPELTWRADRAAQPWIQALADELTLVDRDIVELSRHGRQVLSQLQALDLEPMRAAQAAGDEVSGGLTVILERLSDVRQNALLALDVSRLGPPTRNAVVLLSGATVSAQRVPAHWRDLATDGGRVAGLVDALLRHDGLVFRATTAGRQAQWDDALEFMSRAADPLGDATEVRDALADAAKVVTLDDLIGRYRTHDEALVALYTYIRETGRQAGQQFDTLQRAVTQAKQALPTDTRTMSVIVSEAAGPSLTEALVAIEAAHGDILDALAAVNQ